MKGYGVRCADLALAEVAASVAFEPLFSRGDTCHALARVTVTTRETPWLTRTANSPTEPVSVYGLFGTDGSVQVGLEPLREGSLGHELFHAVDYFAPCGLKDNAHTTWPARHVEDLLARWAGIMRAGRP